MTHLSRMSRRTLGGAALGALGTISLAACGGGGSEDAATSSPAASSPTPSPTAPSTPSASATGATGSASSSPTGSAPATAVAPATGGPMTVDGLSLQAPEGWTVQGGGSFQTGANDPSLASGEGEVLVVSQPSLTSDTLDSLARDYAHIAKSISDIVATRAPDRTIDGVEGYVLTGGGTSQPVSHFYLFGAVTNGHTVRIVVQFLRPLSAAKATAITESVLASVKWT